MYDQPWGGVWQHCFEGRVLVTANTCHDYLTQIGFQPRLRGLVVYDSCPERLGEYLALVYAGRTNYIGPALRTVLTTSERNVLHGVGLGQSNKEVARALGKSEHTVKNQLSAVMRKLGLHTRTELRLYYQGRLEAPGMVGIV